MTNPNPNEQPILRPTEEINHLKREVAEAIKDLNGIREMMVLQDSENDAGDSISTPIISEARQRQAERGKKMIFSFQVGERRFLKDVKANVFARLPDETRLLIAIGQVQDPKYSFLNSDEERQAHTLKLVNKVAEAGEEISSDGLISLTDKCVELGWVSVNGKGPELTSPGMDYLLSKRITMMGNPNQGAEEN
jgi:hypothetical protein